MTAFDPPLPDGVYLDLDAEAYFRQETRGSSDWTRLARLKWGWWWQSAYNPHVKATKSTARTYGSALHAILLEGVAAYEARFVPEPDPDDFPGLLRTTEDCMAALRDAGFDISGTSKWKKADWLAAMRANLPGTPVWDNIRADFETRLGPEGLPGRPAPVSALDDRMLRLLHEIALGDDTPGNEAIRKLFAADPDHPPLVEVSVIATVGGIRRRWRFDRMFPKFDLDLKSLGNTQGRPIEYATGDAIAKLGMDIQRADYYYGRVAAYALIRAGKVFGGTPEQRRYLARWPDLHPKWDWVWLFYQKPDPKGIAPILFPVWDDSWQLDGRGEEVPSDLRGYGIAKLERAIAFYRAAVEEFGFDRPWARVEPLHFTDQGASPRIYLPHWVAEESPAEANAYGDDTDD